MANWILRQKAGDFRGLGQRFNVDPLIIKLLYNRGVDTEEKIGKYLHGTEADFYHPSLMKDMDQAASIILNKIKEKKSIRVIGDYDIDGVTATAILVKGLRFLGGEVDYAIPHRVKDGYGLNPSLVTKAQRDGIDTIVTCDNGISAKVPIDLAKNYGMTVVVTDHHEVPFHEVAGKKEFLLPAADAVVDPKQQEATYPFPGICGGFVAYKLVQLLIEKSIDLIEETAAEEILLELSELAAFATVGDIMELQNENRILVKAGLERMKSSRNLGLRSLISVLEIDETTLSAFHLGFLLGPCINATGRLDTPDRAIKLLLSESEPEAVTLATELKSLNDSRKDITEKATEEAIKIIESGFYDQDKVLVIYLEECHESIAGIVAGRLKEKYDRPVFVVTKAEDGLKGSGRSIESYSMYDEMTKIGDVFSKFGGHAMAAGFSLPEENLSEMRIRLNQNCTLTEEDLTSVIRLDASVSPAYFTMANTSQLALLEPTGNGNERPLFGQSGMEILSLKYLGMNKKAMVVQAFDTKLETRVEFKLFRQIEEFLEFLKEKSDEQTVESLLLGKKTEPVFIDAAYTASINVFRGKKSIQFVLEHYR